MAALLLACTNVAAGTEIHRCLLDDGTVAFQETPCAVPTVDADKGSDAGENQNEIGTTVADDDAFVNPFDEPVNPPTSAEPTHPDPASQDRAECEKTTRDAIDAIDLEMRRNTYTKEEGQEYLSELLVLTQQLRACSRL